MEQNPRDIYAMPRQPQEINQQTGKAFVEAKPHEIFLFKNASDLLYDQIDKALPELEESEGKILGFIKANFKGKKGYEPDVLKKLIILQSELAVKSKDW